ncbi:MAG: hypothetical protein ACOX69_12180, partial [Coriobacteriales bacterium]
SLVLVIGIGMETSGISIPIGNYVLPGMATSALLGVFMNLVLPKPKLDIGAVGGAPVGESVPAKVQPQAAQPPAKASTEDGGEEGEDAR